MQSFIYLHIRMCYVYICIIICRYNRYNVGSEQQIDSTWEILNKFMSLISSRFSPR